MTYSGGYQDPFGGDPFGGQAAGPGPAFGQTQPHHSPAGSGGFPSAPKVNTLATLSAIFAFVFAPAGAALGHIALSQIRQRHQRGRDRAIFGLTASYLIIVLAVGALAVWIATSGEGSNTVKTAAPSPYVPPTPPRTTVITPPPAQRPSVSVSDLRVGDCIEVQQNKPDPSEKADFITIYPVRCEVREGVLQVTQLLSNDSCKTPTTLWNHNKTVYACIVDFKG
ncbi:hypothetical protein DQP58_18910 [Mycobacterium colombiense]|uniref:DUF4190 domain-containing protein n=1 Tax=Mycobacterium colombiense TaxID=339268 RepID=A0A329K9I1_9MYCO|nr:DUF4190 domain-containing protein [Mycobacterium colombiense]RAU92287.1 hypothetical protein DQP58_18910 [Mycobacterium colombiense]